MSGVGPTGVGTPAAPKTGTTSRTIHVPRLMLKRMRMIVAGGALLFATGALVYGRSAAGAPEGWMARPTVPDAIAVPRAAKLVAHFHAVGAQVYVCGKSSGGAPSGWTLARPDATLYDEKGQSVGTHGVGPSWTASDGSSVAAKKVAQSDAPAAGAIPWLLLRADKTNGGGVLATVAYVQRVATKGGSPPSSKCDGTTPNTEKRVDYSAEYYFYSAPPTDRSPAAH